MLSLCVPALLLINLFHNCSSLVLTQYSVFKSKYSLILMTRMIGTMHELEVQKLYDNTCVLCVSLVAG